MPDPEILTDPNQMLGRALAAKDAEIERLQVADRQWADHVKRLADERDELRAVVESKTELISKLVDQGLADKAENERLQAALAMCPDCDCVPRHEYDDLREQLGEIAELRAEVEQQIKIQVDLEHQVADAEDLWREQVEHNRYTAEKHAEHIHVLSAEIERLRSEVERRTRLANVAAERMRTAEYHQDLLKQDIERLRVVVAEVRNLEAIDHGVAWPDLCHALHEFDNANRGKSDQTTSVP